MAELKKIVEDAEQSFSNTPLNDGLDKKVALHKRIVQQVEEEYQIAWKFMYPKITKWYGYLKIYNNKKRKKKEVGDNTMFTIHQTVLSALYGGDELLMNAEAREEGDEPRAENYNALAKYDITPMQKDILDYEWWWDASFFGRAPLLMHDFDPVTKTPKPEVLDPLTTLRDPRCVALNGDAHGRYAARFWGRPLRNTKNEMEEDSGYFNLQHLQKTSNSIAPGNTVIDNLIMEARQARRDAQGYDNFLEHENALQENYEHETLQWFTFFEGDPYIFELANNRGLLVRVIKLKKGNNRPRWGVVERSIFPIAHDYDGVSIPDLTEDK